MLPSCYETPISLALLLEFGEWQAAVFLFIFGILLAVLWFKLRPFWKLIPGVLALCVVVIGVYEPITLQLKMAKARNILAQGIWRETGERFILRESGIGFEAFAVPLHSKCTSGFIVKRSGGGPYDVFIEFDHAYPTSPSEVYASYVRDVRGGHSLSYDKCTIRNVGIDERKSYEICSLYRSGLIFYNAAPRPYGGFEMEWCRNLGEGYSYCEADSAAVGSARGNRY